MVTKPESVHLQHRTTRKFRAAVVLISIFLVIFGGYLAWLAYSILSHTPFYLAGLALLVPIVFGIIIFFLLFVLGRRGIKRERHYLEQYRVEHGIGSKSASRRLKKI